MNTIQEIDKSPFQHLLMLEGRVRLSGATLPEDTDERIQWSGIKCTLSGKNIIVRLNDVSEILDKPKITLIPKCADWVKGVLNLRGRLLPVFDISDYFTDASYSKRSNTSTDIEILVLEFGNLFCGIETQKVHGMQKFYQEDFTLYNKKSKTSDLALSNYYESTTLINNEEWYQLNLSLLTEAIFAKDPSINL